VVDFRRAAGVLPLGGAQTLHLRRLLFELQGSFDFQCLPQVRNDDPYIGKYGMTEIELNKVLEKNSFVKVRDRSSVGNVCDDEVSSPANARAQALA
jgi:hypothetical protein